MLKGNGVSMQMTVVISIYYRPGGRALTRTFFFGAGGLRFKSRTGEIGHSAANGSPPLRHFFERSCVARHNDAAMGLANFTRFDVIQ